MLKTRIKQSGGTGTLVLEGEMIIDHADELKGILLDALQHNRTLDLNLTGISKVDLFGLQVLCSAHRSALKTDQKLTMHGEQPGAFHDAIHLAGFNCSVACVADKTCPWNAK